jgi:hypothetical protein
MAGIFLINSRRDTEIRQEYPCDDGWQSRRNRNDGVGFAGWMVVCFVCLPTATVLSQAAPPRGGASPAVVLPHTSKRACALLSLCRGVDVAAPAMSYCEATHASNP